MRRWQKIVRGLFFGFLMYVSDGPLAARAQIAQQDPFSGASARSLVTVQEGRAETAGSTRLTPEATPSSVEEPSGPKHIGRESLDPTEHDASKTAELLPGWAVFDPLPEHKEKLVRASAFSDSLLLMPPQTTEYFADAEVRSVWGGNAPKLSSEISRLVLRFRRTGSTTSSDSRGEEPEFFDLRIDFRDRVLLFSHSKAAKRSKRGLELVTSDREQERRLIEGLGRSSLVILAPRVELRGQHVRSLILCPRMAHTLDRGRKVAELFFVESPYRLERVSAFGGASVQGQVFTAREIGLARATVRTSTNIPRPQTSMDEAYAVDPSIAFNYVPLVAELRTDGVTDGAFTSAIEGVIELHRTSGFKRVVTERSIVWLKEFLLGVSEPWFLRLRRDQPPARVAPGVCYLMLGEKQRELHYLKEDFVLPERLR